MCIRDRLVGIDNDYVEITDSVIDNNYAQGKGGGLVVANKVIFSKNTLSNNCLLYTSSKLSAFRKKET